jgi:pyruvate dehydrogenase (quinone)
VSEFTEVLRHAGVSCVYGVEQDSLEPIVEAIAGTDGMAWIEVGNERAAAFAAADDAESSGRLAVCAGGYGVGRTGLIRGLRDAHRRGAPVLAVTSPISTEQTSRALAEEIHPERLFAECSHYCGVASHPSEVAWLARTAMQHALVRGGVAVLLLDAPSATSPWHDAEQSESSRVCGRALRRRRALSRVRGVPLQPECAVRRHPHYR